MRKKKSYLHEQRGSETIRDKYCLILQGNSYNKNDNNK